ncbi:hypothetical protein GOODEAATRI_024648 [Goodea atripinnis]|uniref:Uncharacterized protein n=1 Tax=Goodea atripinnis TaxID=208336 RepID=A0ABV0PGS5_9TELE
MFHQAHMLVICSEEELFVADALSSAEGKEEGRGGLASPVPWNILRTSPGVETKLRTVSPRSASLPPCWCRDASLFGGSLSASTIVLQDVHCVSVGKLALIVRTGVGLPGEINLIFAVKGIALELHTDSCCNPEAVILTLLRTADPIHEDYVAQWALFMN